MFAGLKARAGGVVATAAVHGTIVIALIFAANVSRPAGDSARGELIVLQLFNVPLDANQPPVPERVGEAEIEALAASEWPRVLPLAKSMISPQSPVLDRSKAATSGSVEPARSATAVSSADVAVESAYRATLFAHIAKFRAYPDDGRGALGLARVYLEVDRDGRVQDIWIERSSGHIVLDKAAMETVWRAAPLPPIPAELPNSLTVLLPIAFDARSPSRTSSAPATPRSNDAEGAS